MSLHLSIRSSPYTGLVWRHTPVEVIETLLGSLVMYDAVCLGRLHRDASSIVHFYEITKS